MTDLYLKAPTQAAMDAALLAAGLTEEGLPTSSVLIDIIGPITKWDNSVEPPIETVYPEWHVNVRCGELTEDQQAEVSDYIIVPPATPYRVWA